MMSLVDQILGEGAVADLCLWKDKINSGITLVMATLFWFLLEFMEARLVPLLCPNLVTPHAPSLPLGQVRRSLFHSGHLLMLYEIAYGKDNKTFLKTILYVTIIYHIGSYISLLTILYICLVCSLTIPVVYMQFQEVIDSLMEKVSEEKNNLLEVFKNVVSKIPRAPKVE
ncbi:unnamed protein product [Arabidopsis thaliana]|uniref:Reticulon-like protein n=1 Tax=Arabidopsis thaliana TaxID=3702 RepID=A0A7G2E4M2_ARATH|nr:unnamed protein product [Arabidopsis thaliana]